VTILWIPLAALGLSATQYSLASLRYDLSKLRAKGLVEKLPRSRRYRLSSQGYSICLLFLKLFERIYCPLTAGLLQPFKPDSKFPPQKRTELDRLYRKVVDDLEELLCAVGLKAA
jgi:DNA-binding transcriptional ArsR family regulator